MTFQRHWQPSPLMTIRSLNGIQTQGQANQQGDGEKQSCSIPCAAPTIEQGKLASSEESSLNDSREILDSRAQTVEINDHQPNEELESHLVDSIRSIDNHHQNDDLVQINDGHENGNLMQNLPTDSGVNANTTNEENHSPTSIEIVNTLSVQAANTRQHQMVTQSQKGDNSKFLELFISQLGQEFAIKDLGCLNFFLGIEVHYTSLGLILSQSKYALDILSKAQMEGCNSISTPMALKARSSHSSNDAFHDPTHYRSIVGALQYLTFTRPNLSFAINYVCQFMNSPTIGNYQTVKRILSYCTFLGSNCISWCAKKQPTVARSSAEAEYRSMASTTAEITWLAHLLHDIGMALNNAPILHCDNLSAIYMTINPVFHSHTKHVEIDYHFVREKVALGHLITQFVSSTSQLADIFTKPLTRDSFHRLRSKLGLVSLPLPNLRGSNKVSTCEDHFVEPAEGNKSNGIVEPTEGNKSNGNNALEENQQLKKL
ncbi:hypothetical protein SLEP1_g9627 [Rubroshorea leprosula]|uniref:Reverse transcriptase Ty1/copia-type domain-containing protein n=1 Tax=Rubroshorea leprosula TaxID=152421 RepID=A0AAV5IA08_9ROSI|nr:hypothetical protein SLEP1_g9627 [Rubroshorea leprosula]